jgi:hypothetical protein
MTILKILRKASILCVMVLISAGCSHRIYPEKSVTDSVSVVVKDSVIYRDSIIYVQVPTGIASELVPKDSTSHLETQVAESDAWIDNGKLHHTLQNKDVMLPAPIVIPKYIHSEATRQKSDIVRVQRIYQEKQLSAWQSFRMQIGTIFLALVGLYVAFLAVKKFILK